MIKKERLIQKLISILAVFTVLGLTALAKFSQEGMFISSMVVFMYMETLDAIHRPSWKK